MSSDRLQRYDPWRGEDTLYEVRLAPLDIAIQEHAARFRLLARPERAEVAAEFCPSDAHTLWLFACRAAVFAIREHSIGWVRDGLTAMMMIGVDMVDPRDMTPPLALLQYAAMRIGADADELFFDVADLGGASAEWLQRVALSPAAHRGPSSNLFMEVETPLGIGFIDRGTAPYMPSIELAPIILELGQALGVGDYALHGVKVAAELFSHWLGGERCGERIKEIKAAASADLAHRSSTNAVLPEVGMWVFLAEFGRPKDAVHIADRGMRARRTNFSLFTVVVERWLAVAIEKSFMVGVRAVETDESLRRFEGVIVGILKRRLLQ